MTLVILLILTPLAAAAILALTRNAAVRTVTVILSCAGIAALSILVSIDCFSETELYYVVESRLVNYAMFIVEILVTLFIVGLSIRYKKPLAGLLAVIQTTALVLYELSGHHLVHTLTHHFFVDKLSMVMCVIVAFVGGLICIYALSYMKSYHRHHPEVKDRRNIFFSVIFLFFAAMFGIVLSNDLVWIYLFWEITTLCSFLLIGYTRTDEALHNAFDALIYNLAGSLFLAAGIIYFGMRFHVTELKDILVRAGNPAAVAIPALFIAIAGMAKSAQMPFSKWLLGAMVAPTPVSALLHSSTMVKAGVYLILRVSPLLQGGTAGFFVSAIGGLTFLSASLMAITKSDAKKVLAFSTIANLGLIVCCAGIGTYEALWAALFLIIFHAVSKSLLFLSVGSVEDLMGSRDIEDMHGLIVKLPVMALLITVGIAGMFLAPFGMLISKWAAMKAFLDSGNMVALFTLVFGSAATLFYWTKWLGKIVAIRHTSERLNIAPPLAQKTALFTLAVFTVANCLLFPVVSRYIVEPYLLQTFGRSQVIIGAGNQQIMLLLLGMILLLPVGLRFLTRGGRLTTVYMSGVNTGDDRHFIGAGGEEKRMYLSNWYMDRYFGEARLFRISTVATAGLLVFALIYMIGSAI